MDATERTFHRTSLRYDMEAAHWIGPEGYALAIKIASRVVGISDDSLMGPYRGRVRNRLFWKSLFELWWRVRGLEEGRWMGVRDWWLGV